MEEMLNDEVENRGILNNGSEKQPIRVGQEQIHDLLFSDKLSWQAIIYDLINTEQLDPWDIDIIVLSNRFLEKIRALEEANFFVSSKVLFAAALLLRIKSDILLNDDLQSLDDILFGKKEDKKYVQERIELDEEIPGLVARTPLPRFRKVTLAELMASLGKAIATENRRIRKVVLSKQYEREAEAVMPKHNINLKDRIADIYQKLSEMFEKREDKLPFSEISGDTKEERVYAFVSLLHLDNQQKVWLEQENHFDEIWILLKHLYEKKYAQELARMKEEVEKEFDKLAAEDEAKAEDIDKKPFGGRKKKKKDGNNSTNGVIGNVQDSVGTKDNEEVRNDVANKDNDGDAGFESEKVENYEELENAKGFGNDVDSAIENELDEE
jgi:segregation and condensation protein A